MKSPLTFRDISLHRPVIYGFAALWIVLFHMQSMQAAPIAAVRTLSKFGVCGVEMFTLLTVPGLYRSLEKDSNLLRFWKKRLARVYVPAFIMIALVYGLKKVSLSGYLARLLIFPYWLGVDTLWYVPFIMTVYLIYPLLYRIQKRRPRLLWALLALSMAASIGLEYTPPGWTEVCYMAVCRFPILIAGCLLTPCFERGDRIPLWALPALLLAGLGVGLLQDYIPFYCFASALWFAPLSMFAILAVTLLARLCARFPAGHGLYRFLALCGSVSLEIYMLFTRVSQWLTALPVMRDGVSQMKRETVALALTLILALLLGRLSRFIAGQFAQVKIPGAE